MRIRRVLLAGALALIASDAVADQPRMERALEHLRQARAALDEAKANKGGHREKAIEQIGKAEQEVRSGMAAASKQKD